MGLPLALAGPLLPFSSHHFDLAVFGTVWGKNMFVLLFQFLGGRLQEIEPTCFKFPPKALVLSAADQSTTVWVLFKQKFSVRIV